MSEDLAAFLNLDAPVIAIEERFKMRLRIGEDAYALLSAKKNLMQVWDVGGVAATGAGVAASPAVATTLFASTASSGFLGFGAVAAATPVGWVIGAAMLSAGAYYGVSRLFRDADGQFVDTIPKFINTPLDLLAISLFDLMGALALRIAEIDGLVHEREMAAITDHFVTDWGYDRGFVGKALALLAEAPSSRRVKDLAQAIADFQGANPDCNAAKMQADLIEWLKALIRADGAIDEREEHALAAIQAIFDAAQRLTLARMGQAARDTASVTAEGVRAAVNTIGQSATGLWRRFTG